MKNTGGKESLIADISLLLVALIWGGGFIAAKVALSSITPFYLLSFRFLCSGIILYIIFFKKVIKIDRQSFIAGIILGLILYVGQTFQTVGLKYTTPGKQSFLTASYAAMVPFASWLVIRKIPNIYAILAGFLTLIGIGFLSLQQNISIGFGDSLTLLFTVVYSFQIILIGIYARRNINPINLTTVQLLSAGIFTLISALIFEPPMHVPDIKGIYGILYLIIFNTAIAFLVQNAAQKYTSDTRASIILSLESVFGCFLSVLLMGEVFTKKMIIGCIIIFIAVILSKIDKLHSMPIR
ncbi:DMT family transporter [Clostridium luticellarii]|uniref:Putative DMT superfamily transporter inner membrane protein n=1 Tax=Clostridium luticellarii TaxID=1691940 RepID=A0A2T0BST0_9CLOT|nr:DMT family transporter [Clostridium luticellarii]MCI1945618.1 DMT family transporter [Clostridium luticellarii]MCI1969404.1 DMT family transporter [Clostridium luticellarii]MCI1996464.1 DMT family transporter [Clostridium luticellarii]MCI2040817.1 DMT family transporter [Clostridium luticellarii]PRR86920.1 putative DMT superfamily transporter inner membrane protein [Clostridium luticellarii]